MEAEIVAADGEVRIANACTNPDLFWALKGGGGGFGVVTRVTVRTHPLPEFFGGVFATIRATSDDACPPPYRQNSRILRPGALQSALGRADRLPARRRGYDFNGLPGATAGRGRGGLAPVLRLGLRFAAGFRHRVGAADRRVAGPAFWDPSVLKSVPGRALSRRSRRRAGGRYILGWKPRGGGRRLARLPVRLAARRPSSHRTSANTSSTRFSPPLSTGA